MKCDLADDTVKQNVIDENKVRDKILLQGINNFNSFSDLDTDHRL
jgi:hypothetical protein